MSTFDIDAFKRQQQHVGAANAKRPGTIAYEIKQTLEGKPPFVCKFCGAPSWIDPSDQEPPTDYCHENDHGSQTDYEDYKAAVKKLESWF